MGDVQQIAYFLIGLGLSGLLLEVARAAIWMGMFAFLFRRPIRAFVKFCKENSR